MTEFSMYEFARRREGMVYALSGGLWFHRHVYRGERMAHLVSSDRTLLMRVGRRIGLKEEWLQYKPLKDPRHGRRVDAWHWDLRGWSLDVGLQLTRRQIQPGERPPAVD